MLPLRRIILSSLLHGPAAFWPCVGGRRMAPILLSCLFVAPPCAAHTSGLSHNQVSISAGQVRYDIGFSAHDIAQAIGLDGDATAATLTENLRLHRTTILTYVRQRLLLSSQDGACRPADSRIDYSALPETVDLSLGYVCPPGMRRLGIDYRLFFDQDPGHTAMGVIRLDTRKERFLFDRGLHRIEFDLNR